MYINILITFYSLSLPCHSETIPRLLCCVYLIRCGYTAPGELQLITCEIDHVANVIAVELWLWRCEV